MAEIPSDQVNALARLAGALAEEKRLAVFAAIVLGARNEDEVAAAAGLKTDQLRPSLSRLVSAGLVESTSSGFVARSDRLRDAVAAIRRTEREAAPTALSLGASPEQAAVLDRFLVDGRLGSIPVRGRRRTLVLDFLAGRFAPGRRYTEREVNEILGRLHDDVASLRRLLVDEEFLSREDGRYWRSGGTFAVD